MAEPSGPQLRFKGPEGHRSLGFRAHPPEIHSLMVDAMRPRSRRSQDVGVHNIKLTFVMSSGSLCLPYAISKALSEFQSPGTLAGVLIRQ